MNSVPDEKLFKRPLCTYRIKFQILSSIKDWDDGISPPPKMLLNVGRRVIEKKIFDLLFKNATAKWIKSNNT